MSTKGPKTTEVEKKIPKILIVGLVLLSVFSGFVGGWIGSQSVNQQMNRLHSGERAREIVRQESEVISDIVEQIGESVVSVNVTRRASATDFFGFQRSLRQQSAGTGFILSTEGIILTNRHVVPSGVERVSVTLSDGTELDNVSVIGRTGSNDPLDVAFLKINDTEGKILKPVKLGDSSNTKVGSRVIAIGNALGRFQNTVTAGIISGYGRSVTAYDETGADTLQNLFQTDAAVNQGNSGGPLVNINGEVIGVNTAVAGGGAENIGFAIPIDDIKGLISSVLETGELKRPYLGVRYVQLTDDFAKEQGLPVNRGAYIVPNRNGNPSVLPDSPAEKAGLQEKDIIIKVNDKSVNEQSLSSLLGQFKVGTTVELTILRGGQEKKLSAILEAAPSL